MTRDLENTARGLGFQHSYIYGVNKIFEKFANEESEGLWWFLLHILYQWDTGHLRTSLVNLKGDVSVWFDEESMDITIDSLVSSIPSAIRDNPGVFGLNKEPFILDGNYVYINRVKKYEQNFIELLKNRLDYGFDSGDDKLIFNGLDNESDAVKKAITKNFLIISGGPGTGKTTTIISILRALKKIGLENIRLAAPTGRAAKRMTESIRSQLLEGEELPCESSTLHSLLGTNSNGAKFSNKRRLNVQGVIVDEASMVDIHLMFRLFDALDPSSKLILVGDKNQLPSVEAGALLEDFLDGSEEESHRMHSNIVMLLKSYRSEEGIRKLGELVINGDANGVNTYLTKDNTGVLRHNLPGIDELINTLIKEFPVSSPFRIPRNLYEEKVEEINKLFLILSEFAVLTPSRRGLYGTTILNNRISIYFNPSGKPFFHGQPIMITKNDYVNSLFNGDRGIILGFTNGLFAFFMDGEGYKIISVSKLVDYETSYVGTVHKSQGSEFTRVAVILPKGTERLLSREILYTALTRAKINVDLYAEGDSIELAVQKKIVRHSGIQDFLKAK